MIYIDSDNALGSKSGDIDDAFAIAALLCGHKRSEKTVGALGSVFGNTTASEVQKNNQSLARFCGYSGSCLLGANKPGDPSDASRYLAQGLALDQVLALGPMTNFAAALRENPQAQARVGEFILVGANWSSNGRWPPYWPFEFNLTHDAQATAEVFNSRVPLTIIPLDQARRLRLRSIDFPVLSGELANFLESGSRRWLLRARRFKFSSSVPVWDLAAAIWAIEPALFQSEVVKARIHPNGWIEFRTGDRKVRVVTDYDPEKVWKKFRQLSESRAAN